MAEAAGPTPEKAQVAQETPASATEEPKSKTEEPKAASAGPTADAATPTEPEKKSSEPKKPYDILLADLESILQEADHDEVYGLKLTPSGDPQTSVILQKFLRANANDIPKAKEQLLSTLKWRKEFQPLKARDEVFSRDRFDGLGHVVKLEDVVVTFNVYGGVKDNKVTFEDIPGFIRWRVALMELGLARVLAPLFSSESAAAPIPDYNAGPDPYQGIQVHDYLDVSFLRQNPYVKAASKEAINTFQNYYPETLSRKFFVNVPVVMGWMFAAVKVLLPKETVRKFTVLSYGNTLAGELGKGVPKVYGGDAEGLEVIGEGLKLE